MVASSFGLMTAVKASIGGILLGFATSIHYILYKRFTGVSGIIEKAMTKDAESWQLSFLLGIYHSACIYVFATGGIIFREIPFIFTSLVDYWLALVPDWATVVQVDMGYVASLD